MGTRELIIKELEPLFEQAEKEGLWIHSIYQDMWFTPKELRECHAEGRFIWGLVNWELRSPHEKIKSLEDLKTNTDIQIKDIYKRIETNNKLKN